ncbi:MAG: hypothetical protein ABJC13_23610 [Acidobacteriota bacterium]
MIRILVLLLAGAAAVWSFRNWRRAVQVVMVLLILEGAIRKWIFPGAQDIVYFGKDLLLLGIYLGFLSRDRPGFRPPQLQILFGVLGAGALFGALEIFNPHLPSLLIGVLGFKAYFFYVPLYWVLPAAFSSDAELARFLRLYGLIAIPVGLLAAAQFVAPSSSVLNTYARAGTEASDITTFGTSSRVRVTATFAYITGFTSYLFANVALLLALLGAERWRMRRNLWLFSALGLTLLGMMMSGSRGPIAVLIVLMPIYGWLAIVRERGSGATTGRLVVALLFVGGIAGYFGTDAIAAWRDRASGTTDTGERLLVPFTAPFLILDRAGLFGYGIGATHQMATAIIQGPQPFYWLDGPNTEVESGRVMLELGPLGFLLTYMVRLILVAYALRQVLALRTLFHRSVAVGCLLFFIAQLTGTIVFEVTSGLYYWFFAGLLTTVVALDRQAVLAAFAAQPRPVSLAGTVRTGTARGPLGAPAFAPPASRRLR